LLVETNGPREPLARTNGYI